MTRIAVFASGEGTNLQALLDACRGGRVRGEISLVVSNREETGALSRARRAGVPCCVLNPKDFPNQEEYSAELAARCRQAGIDLICLAGFLQQLKEPLLRAFPDRILNVHPSLLPAFGGKGMYGVRVHEAVLSSGAKVSGCSVHFVDAFYDHGPVVSQHPVAVFQDDTPAALAARVRAQEHWAYPEAVRLFCEGRLEVAGGRVRIRSSHRDQPERLRRALVSVSDKTGLAEFCRALAELGVEIVSTSGTAKTLTAASVAVRPMDSMTGFPEILNGRVKTLHPRIHGGILLRRRDPAQEREALALGLEPIDMVIVNLYPFAQAAAAAPTPFAREALEQIDVGGVALLRAAAKNFEDVAVLVSPADYPAVLDELERSQGRLSLETRRGLALAAFRHTAVYDAMICDAWDRSPELSAESPAPSAPAATERDGLPPVLSLALVKAQELRYGENPHQRAALYLRQDAPGAKISFEQLHGKQLSYNNLLDASASWEAVSEFQEPACVIIKHVTPCGIGVGRTPREAFEKAWACDPDSAYGGVLAVNRPLDPELAQALAEKFLEVLCAPAFQTAAIERLKQKQNLRLILRRQPPSRALELRSIGSEALVMEPDRLDLGPLTVVSRRPPVPAEDTALRFAWKACKHARSNAVVLAGQEGTVGIGAGQMSRVDSVRMAGLKYQAYLSRRSAPQPLALASDAFFPFRDGIDAAAKLGISAVIQPGGSVRDHEVISAADEHGLAMVFTGMRHFRH